MMVAFAGNLARNDVTGTIVNEGGGGGAGLTSIIFG
jgi:hypothetical protein